MKYSTPTHLFLISMLFAAGIASTGLSADTPIKPAEESTSEQLLERIQKLEVQVQVLQSNLVAAKAQTNIIRAGGIEIVDNQGNVKLTLCAMPNGVAGLFMPTVQNSFITLGMGADNSPMLLLHDSNRFRSSVTSSMFAADNGQGITAEISTREKSAFVILKNAAEASGAFLSNKDGLPALTVGGKRGEVIVAANNEGALVSATTIPGKAHADLSANTKGAGVSLIGEDGKRRGISTAGDLKE